MRIGATLDTTRSRQLDRVAAWLTTFMTALEALVDDENSHAVDEALDAGVADTQLWPTAFQELGPQERRILLVTMVPELDSSAGRLYGQLAETMVVSRPSVALCLDLAASTVRDELELRKILSPGSHLVEGGWVRVLESRSRTFLESEVKVAQPAVDLFLGQPSGRADADDLGRVWPPGPRLDRVVLRSNHRRQVDSFLERVRNRSRGEGSLVLLLSGPSGTGKTLTARAVAAELGMALVWVDPLGGLSRHEELERRLEQLTRQARLLDGILFFDECEGWFESRLTGQRTVLRMLELLDRQDQVIILATNMADTLDPALDRRVALRLGFEMPKRPLREALWDLYLPSARRGGDIDIGWLAERYELTGSQIANAAEAALQLARAGGHANQVSNEEIEAACEQQVRHRLSRLAVETPTRLTLADLVVSDDVQERLLEIMAAIRNRRVLFEEWGFGRRLSKGRGLCILFRGDPGTGKTLAAEVIAAELKLPLYRASIPKIVSKYIGETERNLERTFREAQAAGGILLFDEADALFSKRVEVSTAQDRYSNMEVNLLLQEIEHFDGVVVLTTNKNAAIDEAFERRLNFKIDFLFPEAKHRAKIWELLIPDEAPVEGVVDFHMLGECFELSGGSIKNSVVRAAYAAAQRGEPLSQDVLEEAARKEYKELGKLYADNRWD
jgi:SpoVK/Ycf46/Vps4 family AAA+-type ATPase